MAEPWIRADKLALGSFLLTIIMSCIGFYISNQISEKALEIKDFKTLLTNSQNSIDTLAVTNKNLARELSLLDSIITLNVQAQEQTNFFSDNNVYASANKITTALNDIVIQYNIYTIGDKSIYAPDSFYNRLALVTAIRPILENQVSNVALVTEGPYLKRWVTSMDTLNTYFFLGNFYPVTDTINLKNINSLWVSAERCIRNLVNKPGMYLPYNSIRMQRKPKRQ